ncbi:hypothetical protein HMPREF9120_01795 [Neisseria sp. oral taxon 020 str. F0370]|nr:hypothetical protein HMPREF9120_01795 [Neisseria sp. oral taxon 020 str. F0370]
MGGGAKVQTASITTCKGRLNPNLRLLPIHLFHLRKPMTREE